MPHHKWCLIDFVGSWWCPPTHKKASENCTGQQTNNHKQFIRLRLAKTINFTSGKIQKVKEQNKQKKKFTIHRKHKSSWRKATEVLLWETCSNHMRCKDGLKKKPKCIHTYPLLVSDQPPHTHAHSITICKYYSSKVNANFFSGIKSRCNFHILRQL